MLDWNRINELHGEVGDAEFQLILEMFLDEVEGVMMRLSHDDPVLLETDLHFLKGCASNLGFSAFGALCNESERRICQDRSAHIGIADLMDSYSQSKKELMRGLDGALHPLRKAL